jgi:hypothetical protein
VNKVVAGICSSDFRDFSLSLINKKDGFFDVHLIIDKKMDLFAVRDAYESYFSENHFPDDHLLQSFNTLFELFKMTKRGHVVTRDAFKTRFIELYQKESTVYDQLLDDFPTSLCALQFTKLVYTLFQNCDDVFNVQAFKSIKFVPPQLLSAPLDDSEGDLSGSLHGVSPVKCAIERLNSKVSSPTRSTDTVSVPSVISRSSTPTRSSDTNSLPSVISRSSTPTRSSDTNSLPSVITQSSSHTVNDDTFSLQTISSAQIVPFGDIKRFFNVVPQALVVDALKLLLNEPAKNKVSLDELNLFAETLVNDLFVKGVVKGGDTTSSTYFLFNLIKNELLVEDLMHNSTVKMTVGFLKAHYFLKKLAKDGVPDTDDTFKKVTDASIYRLTLFYCYSWLKEFSSQKPDFDVASIFRVRQQGDFFLKLNALVRSQNLPELNAYLENMKDEPFSEICVGLIDLLPIPQPKL